MYATLLALAMAPAQPPANTHDARNPLFKRLTDTGLDVGGKKPTALPAPTMPDGLTAAKQTEVIKGLIGTDYSYAEFTRDAVVAPQLLKIRDVADSDPKAPGRGLDVWFVVYGDFKRLEDDKFLDTLLSAGKGTGGGKGGPLTAADLAKRNIMIPKEDEKRVSYGTVEFDFLEKARLNATGHAMWSRTPDSVVAAAEIDPRFQGDKEFPNQWRPIVKEGGRVTVGAPAPVERGGDVREGDQAGRAGRGAVRRAARRVHRADRLVRRGQPAPLEAAHRGPADRPQHAPGVQEAVTSAEASAGE